MSGEIATILESLPANKYATKENMAMVASGGGWLPRLQLFIATSNLCKAGQFPPNKYGLVRSRTIVDDLSAQVNVVPLSWRPKAADLANGVNHYNPVTVEFKRVQKLSEEFGNNCMSGPEFLVWIPVAKSFATFFMNSITAQSEAPNLASLIGKPASLKIQIIPHKKYGPYASPLPTPCSEVLDMPPMEDLKIQIEKFNNPKESEVEVAEDPERDR